MAANNGSGWGKTPGECSAVIGIFASQTRPPWVDFLELSGFQTRKVNPFVMAAECSGAARFAQPDLLIIEMDPDNDVSRMAFEIWESQERRPPLVAVVSPKFEAHVLSYLQNEADLFFLQPLSQALLLQGVCRVLDVPIMPVERRTEPESKMVWVSDY